MTNVKTGEGLLEAFIKHLQEYPLLQAAYTEAVHRFYFDTCFSPYSDRPYDTEECKLISNLLQTLSCQNAGWRHTLSKGIERYKGGEVTTALFIESKPKEIINLEITHKIVKQMRKVVELVLLNDKGEVLGVSRKTDHNDFGLIGGKVDHPDDNDDPERAIIRECLEETGLKISNLRLIYSGDFWNKQKMSYTYLADWTGEISTTEPHVVKWTNFEELTLGSFGDFNLNISNILRELNVPFVF